MSREDTDNCVGPLLMVEVIAQDDGRSKLRQPRSGELGHDLLGLDCHKQSHAARLEARAMAFAQLQAFIFFFGWNETTLCPERC